MRRIPLTKGKFALVDDEDYNRIVKYKWLAKKGGNAYYAFRWACVKGPDFKIKRRYIGMHQLILNLPISEIREVDHMDGNGLNNQKSNLRDCSRSENMCNRSKLSNNTSGYKGVRWKKENNKWNSYIRKDNKVIHLGYFFCIIKAAKAYDIAAIKYHGEFARLNFPV